MTGDTAGVRPNWVSDQLFPFPFESRFVRLGGHVVHYVDEGEGPTLPMLHGDPTATTVILPGSATTCSDAVGRLFGSLADELREVPGVEEGTGFGRMPGLRSGGRIFAMLCRGDLVVKLPGERVDFLVESGAAARFEPRRDGRLMREWAAICPARYPLWEPLAHEALAFVATPAAKTVATPTHEENS